MVNKFNFNQKESIFLLKRNLASLIYSAGKFENLPTTLLDTELIINNHKVKNIKPSDIQTIMQLKRGYEYITNNFRQVTFEDMLTLNGIVAKYDALYPGQVREIQGGVSTLYGHYTPPMTNLENEKKYFNDLLSKDICLTEKAIRLFLHIAKTQVFYDSNKRTAFLMANYLLSVNGHGIFVIKDENMEEFFELLAKYYLDMINEDKMVNWLYDHAISSFGFNKISLDKTINDKINEFFELVTNKLKDNQYLKIKQQSLTIFSDKENVLMIEFDQLMKCYLLNIEKSSKKLLFEKEITISNIEDLIKLLEELNKTKLVNIQALKSVIKSIKDVSNKHEDFFESL